MPNNVGVIVVGVGFVGGQAHTPSFKKIEGSNLIGLCARTENRVKPLAEKYDVGYFLDYDKALDEKGVDAVVLSVPNPLHYPMAIKAIEKGKHVMCEMPIAATLNEVKELKQAAEAADLLLMPVLNFRWAPIYVKVKEMIQAGDIGEPIAVHYREFLPAKDISEQWPLDSWAWSIERSGGYPDFTLSVWSIDMLRWMFGQEYAEIEWKSNYPTFEEFGGIYGYNTMGVFKLDNGIVGTLHLGASVNEAASTTRLEVYGDNTNVLHGIWNDQVVLYDRDGEKQETNLPVKGTRVWGHRQIDTHFINCLLGKEEPMVTMEDAIKAQEIASKIVKT